MAITSASGGRPKEGRRALSERGTEYGVAITPRDRERLIALGRWYTLNTSHLARMELAPLLWHPDHTQLPSSASLQEYDARLYAIKRRFARLGRIQEQPGNQTGPLIGAMRSEIRKASYFLTRYGSTLVGSPWQGRPSINPDSIEHAWLAADIGLQLERARLKVLSERELTTGVDWLHTPIDHSYESHYETSEGRRVTKKPDLVIPAPTGDDYIAVEVERGRRWRVAAYTEKLRAYRDNTSIRAIWFVCENDATADRVGSAAERVFGNDSSFPLRIRVATHYGDFYELPNLTRDADLVADVNAIRNMKAT